MTALDRVAFVSAAVLLAGCSDQIPTANVPVAPASPVRFDCVASPRDLSVSCGHGGPAGERASIFGSQNIVVRVSSANVRYDRTTAVFSADLRVTNLSEQPMGTLDGVTPHGDGVRVFFHTGPNATSGSGGVWVLNPDGYGAFTAAGQPYYAWPGILRPGETTAPRAWTWHVETSVARFGFTLLVDTQLPPLLLIDEIMAHPTTASEAAGEWIELFNAGVSGVDLYGWSVAAAGGTPHTFGTHVVVPAGGYAVVGGSTSTGVNGGAAVQAAWSGVRMANDTTGWVALRTPWGSTMDSVSWGAASGATASPPPEGVALALDSLRADNLHLGGADSPWHPSPGFFGDGQYGSPGGRNLKPLSLVSIVPGSEYTCGLDAVGQGWCWGYGYEGSLGNGTREDRLAAVPMLQTGLRFVDMAVVATTTCMLEEAGGVYCTGAFPPFEYWGPLAPTLELAGDYRSLWGGLAVCALGAAGEMWCVGYWFYTETYEFINAADELGSVVPTAVTPGYGFVCVLNAAGKALCSGRGGYGELGNGTFTDLYAFRPVVQSDSVVFTTITGAGSHTCALTTDGEVYCWGRNNMGQLGDGTHTNRAVPTAVPRPAGVTFSAITAAGNHTCALGSDGRAYCWGENGHGQLGDGTTTARALPVSVHLPPGFTVSAIGTYSGHTCAVVAPSGQPACWGWNVSGELGDGTRVQRLVPVSAGR